MMLTLFLCFHVKKPLVREIGMNNENSWFAQPDNGMRFRAGRYRFPESYNATRNLEHFRKERRDDDEEISGYRCTIKRGLQTPRRGNENIVTRGKNE